MDGLYGYAMVLSRNPVVAADLVQETYLRALKAKTSLRASSNVKGWLFTILRNIWLNHLRHERAGPKIAALEPDETLADGARYGRRRGVTPASPFSFLSTFPPPAPSFMSTPLAFT